MNNMFDVDTINQINAENRKELSEIREKKNQILNILNYKRKQEEWDKLFPKSTSDELNNLIF